MKRSLALSAAVFVSVATANASADPSKVECVAANDQARDLRRAGNLKAAREQLAVCIAQSCPGPVREDCAQRLTEIATAQPSIVFAAKDGAGNDLSAVKVAVDGQTFAEKLDGSALDVDPGEHTFRFEGGGGVTEKRLVVREGEKGRRETVVMGATSAASASLSATRQSGSTQRTTGLVLGGVGIAGLVVGTIFGVVAVSTKSSNPSPTESQVNLVKTSEWGCDLGLGIGIAGLAVGSILFFTSPQSVESAHATASLVPWVGFGSAGVKGTFQ